MNENAVEREAIRARQSCEVRAIPAGTTGRTKKVGRSGLHAADLGNMLSVWPDLSDKVLSAASGDDEGQDRHDVA